MDGTIKSWVWNVMYRILTSNWDARHKIVLRIWKLTKLHTVEKAVHPIANLML